MSGAVNCKQCSTPTDPLGMFPGDVCLSCWAQNPEGRRMPTAGEVTRMWGDPRRRAGNYDNGQPDDGRES